MASAAEQLAANINLSAFAKAEELKKRIWFTLGALIIYRLGTYIPLPGIDPAAFEASFTGQQQGVLDMFNMFSGGAVQRMAVFALNIMPYISASIIIQLLSSVFPRSRRSRKRARRGARSSTNIPAISPSFSPSSRLMASPSASRAERRRQRPGPAVPHLDRHHADRRHDVPGVARRADHLARRRQRLLADHLRRHRRAPFRRRSSNCSNLAVRARFRPASCSPSS